MKRRGFVYTGAALAAGAVRASTVGPNSTVRAATIGVNGRGMSHVEQLLKQKKTGVDLVALCDVDADVLGSKAAAIEKKEGVKVDGCTDMRELFDRKDLDVVTVATPNHWHALATIWACEAGKDVYVEKPGSHNVHEGRAMMAAAEKHGRIVQHGVQLRSSEAIQQAVEHLRKGVIGDVYMARGLCFKTRGSVGKKPSEPAPKGLDWNIWQGPAQERPFSKKYVHYNWHWHWDFGNGDIGNQGVHQTDMCLWGMGLGLPTEVQAMGGRVLFDDDKETPEVLSACFFYPDRKKMIQFEVRPWTTNNEAGVGIGNIFYGSKGYMVIKGYDAYETFLGENGKKVEPGPKGKDKDPMGKHFANFLDAVRSRKPESLNGPVKTAHESSALAHLANISHRVGRRLTFDPQTEKFVDASDANALLTRNYRAPFVVK